MRWSGGNTWAGGGDWVSWGGGNWAGAQAGTHKVESGGSELGAVSLVDGLGVTLAAVWVLGVAVGLELGGGWAAEASWAGSEL